MILALTPNPAVDVTYFVDELVPGETHRIERLSTRAGGKGLNVARVVDQLGGASHALAPLGGVSGAWIAGELAREEVEHTAIDTGVETRRSVAVVPAAGHPTVLNEAGLPLPAEAWDGLAARLSDLAAEASVVTISGSLPPGAPAGLLGRLVAAARTAPGPRVVLVDTSGPGLLAAADAGADYVKPNEAELLAATGAADWAAGAAELLARGVGAVLLSRGADGYLLVRPGSVVGVAGLPRLDGNPTGAGDASVAGFAVALAAGEPPERALTAAAAAGAAAVLRPTAGDIDTEAYPRIRAGLTLTTDTTPTTD